MTIAGNICLGLASVLCVLLFIGVSSGMGKQESATTFAIAGWIWCPLVGTAFCAAVAQGKLDAVGWPRGFVYAAIILACVAIASVAVWIAAAASGLAGLIVMTGVILAALVCLNFSDSAWGRYGLLGVMSLGLLAALAQIGVWLFWSQQGAARHVVAIEERTNDRDSAILEEVKTADAEKDFGMLLGHTGRFENRKIAALALEKVRSTARFDALMAETLRNGNYFRNGFKYLSDHDPAPAAKAELAGAVRDAVLLVGQSVREIMRQEYNPRGSQFVDDASEVIAVVGKFEGLGVDFSPAMREYRASIEEPGRSARYQEETLKDDLRSRKQLDQWLTAYAQ